MYVKLPKASLFFAVFASIPLFFACDGGINGQAHCGPEAMEMEVKCGMHFSSSDGNYDNLPQGNSSSSAKSSSVEEEASSSSVTVSSSGAKSSSSVRGSSSSVKASSSSVKASSSSTAEIVPFGCSRAGLESAVNSYLAALEAGDYTLMTLTSTAKYIENDNSAGYRDRVISFGNGLWQTPIIPDFHRNLIDEQECATFTEIIVANSQPQYVLGTRLKVSGNQISEVRVIVTQNGDWGFNAKDYLKYSAREDWSELPADQRLSREELRAAGYAYFAYFGDNTVEAPWGIPCARLEGGTYTGDYPNSSCKVGIPDQKIDPAGISYLADVDYGMVVLFFYFGGADSHMFRVLPTGYRYIHTLTAMRQSDFKQ